MSVVVFWLWSFSRKIVGGFPTGARTYLVPGSRAHQQCQVCIPDMEQTLKSTKRWRLCHYCITVDHWVHNKVRLMHTFLLWCSSLQTSELWMLVSRGETSSWASAQVLYVQWHRCVLSWAIQSYCQAVEGNQYNWQSMQCLKVIYATSLTNNPEI